MSEGTGRAEMERRLVERSLQDEVVPPEAAGGPQGGRRRGTRNAASRRCAGTGGRGEGRETIYLVLPSASPVGEGGELSDRELETVAGGGSTAWGETCSCGSPGYVCTG